MSNQQQSVSNVVPDSNVVSDSFSAQCWNPSEPGQFVATSMLISDPHNTDDSDDEIPDLIDGSDTDTDDEKPEETKEPEKPEETKEQTDPSNVLNPPYATFDDLMHALSHIQQRYEEDFRNIATQIKTQLNTRDLIIESVEVADQLKKFIVVILMNHGFTSTQKLREIERGLLYQLNRHLNKHLGTGMTVNQINEREIRKDVDLISETVTSNFITTNKKDGEEAEYFRKACENLKQTIYNEIITRATMKDNDRNDLKKKIIDIMGYSSLTDDRKIQLITYAVI
jgi:hypothetical protein